MAETAGFAAIRRTLQIKSYRTYTSSNFFSQLGMWVQRIAVAWLTWELTKSPTWLGIMAFADFFPNVVMAPLAGALADRVDRLPAIRLYVSIAGAMSAVLAVLTLGGFITVELLLLLVLANGTAMSFNYPARLSIIHALVGREALTTAISINALLFNIARIGGPALSGFIIVNWDVGPAFAFAAIGNFVFVAAMFRVRLIAESARRERRSARHIPAEIMDGFRYAARHPGIGPLLVLLVMTSIFARPFIDLFPGFADEVFGRGADGLAWLTSMVGVGAFIGSLYLMRHGGVEGLTRTLVTGVLIFALAILGFVATDIFPVALACTALAGTSVVIIGVVEQTLVQASTDGAMRGRMLSLYTLVARGFPSLGALMMGWLASFLRLPRPVAGGALICIGLWLWALRRQRRMAAALEVEPDHRG